MKPAPATDEQPIDILEPTALGHFLAGVVEFETGDEVDRVRSLQRLRRQDGDVRADEAQRHLGIDVLQRLGRLHVGTERGRAGVDDAQLEIPRLVQDCLERNLIHGLHGLHG